MYEKVENGEKARGTWEWETETTVSSPHEMEE
jgi:hypothetical protein